MAGPGGLIIAIDGVVGSGKSTTARGVAAVLGYRHVDTGAMYRALTLAAMNRGVSADDEASLGTLLEEVVIELEPANSGGRVFLDGTDVSDAIRQPEVSRAVGAFANVAQVRGALVKRQQVMGTAGGVVADGRDVGSVIFPNADLKVHMTADIDERARRRHRELKKKGLCITLKRVKNDIHERDREDAERDYGGQPDLINTLELDTSELTLQDQIDHIVTWARERGA